jgi:hypothetical protein
MLQQLNPLTVFDFSGVDAIYIEGAAPTFGLVPDAGAAHALVQVLGRLAMTAGFPEKLSGI